MQSAPLPAFDLSTVNNPRAITRAGALLALALVLGVGTWSALAPLSGAVIASGYVKVDMNRRTVQHQEGGIVREILVRDGSRVRTGQPLLVLDDVRVDANHELLRTQLDAESARAARLDAERSALTQLIFPADLMARKSEPPVAQSMLRESALFAARRDALHEQLQLIATQSREIDAEIGARSRQATSDTRALALQQQDVRANEALVAEGFVSKSRLALLQRTASDYESRRHQNEAEMAQSRQRASELHLRAATLRNSFMQQAAEEHKQAVATLLELREKLRPWADARQRLVITAPAEGEVVNLRFTSPGAVIGPREAVLDIVPSNVDLVVEARIRPEDINSVRSGAAADVRLTAYKQRVTPVVEGEVLHVSADRMEDRASAQAFYVVQVKVPAQALRAAGIAKLQAGMPAEVFVKTGERSALAYILEPVTGFLQHSMREP